MYSSQEAAFKIRTLAKEKGVAIADLLENCNLNINALSQSAKSQEGMKAKNLYAIADYLDCSIDYLLGRTDNPNSHKL